jgi:hypothetical protein
VETKRRRYKKRGGTSFKCKKGCKMGSITYIPKEKPCAAKTKNFWRTEMKVRKKPCRIVIIGIITLISHFLPGMPQPFPLPVHAACCLFVGPRLTLGAVSYWGLVI